MTSNKKPLLPVWPYGVSESGIRVKWTLSTPVWAKPLIWNEPLKGRHTVKESLLRSFSGISWIAVLNSENVPWGWENILCGSNELSQNPKDQVAKLQNLCFQEDLTRKTSSFSKFGFIQLFSCCSIPESILMSSFSILLWCRAYCNCCSFIILSVKNSPSFSLIEAFTSLCVLWQKLPPTLFSFIQYGSLYSNMTLHVTTLSKHPPVSPPATTEGKRT